MYFDLLDGFLSRFEGGITWSARGAGSPSFNSDRLTSFDSGPPIYPNSGEPGMVITWFPELPSAGRSSSPSVAGWLNFAD